MKKINDAKKLQLHTETIQTLTREDLEGVAGAAGGKGVMLSSADFICTAQPVCCDNKKI